MRHLDHSISAAELAGQHGRARRGGSGLRAESAADLFVRALPGD